MSINLQKVTLQRQGDTHRINLSKDTLNLTKEILINLNWSQGAKGGLLSGLFGKKGVDLDLGCFYELSNGEKTVIDGLQFAHGQGGSRDRNTRQGSYTGAPWIWHSGDDRGGSGEAGENILVNPNGLREIKRMVIYCFIYEGVARWEETNGVVTVNVPGNAVIEVQMGRQNSTQPFCAIAEILFAPESLQVKKLVTFHQSHGECDRTYHWGMQWTNGSK